jgi:hypothetical protein
MNRTFEKLNPVIIKRGFETNKKIAIIMNKLLCGQYPNRFVFRHNQFEIHFIDDFAKSQFHSYGNSNELKISFDRDGTHFCNLFINTKDLLFKIEYKVDISTDCTGTESGLLSHIKSDGRFEVTAKSFLRYQIDSEKSDEITRYMFPNGDHFYSYLKFFEENINNRLAKMCQIQDFNNPGLAVTLSIADFYKMCNKGILENNKLPSNAAVCSLINDLIYMNESKIDRIQAGILRITKTSGNWGTYRIYFGGAIVCNEYSIKRFKYTFHPGLQLVAKYLESDQKVETLRHKIEKEMFKKM